MPNRPPTACPKCGALIAYGARCGRCPPRWKVRPTAHASGYTKAWARYSLDWRARFPFCGQRVDGAFHGDDSACARSGKHTIARVVDHIRAITDGGDMWDERNHQSLCHVCHNVKTETEIRNRATLRPDVGTLPR